MGKTRLGRATRVAFTGLAAASLATGAMLAAAPLASAAPAAPQSSTHAVANPYSPAYNHPYRHGAVPTVQQNAKMKSWQAAQPAATGPETLSYGGGVDGIGVQSGHSKVYLVFYGTQWGTQGTNSSGDLTFSGDPDNAAPVAQEMFKGIGTGNELWSADLTQWCDGPNVASGATSCPSNANFVPYQSGGVLSGVWYDNSAASPSAASGHQLGTEAVKAASHFGNTTAASNRYAYYVILSPHGTNPDSYQNQYCAWHDWNGDSTLTGGAVSSSVGDIAFSNQPYNMDSGAGCGVGFVNSPGTLDGWTMTLGHEWHEEMSDQNPAGGWTNHTSSSYSGQENSDECAWISAGQAGGAANVSMGTGTFTEQASWSNDTNACAISHPIVGGGGTGNTVTVTNPGSKTGTVGTATSLQISASDSASGQTLTYSASGLPTGLSINSSTGLISGTPSAAGTFSVTATAKDTTGATGSASFTWTISGTGGGGCTPAQLLGNPGFETGSASPWTASSGVIDNSTGEPAHSGSWKAWLNGYGTTHTDTLSQTVTIPAGCTTANFTFYLHIDTAETTTTTAYDKLTVTAGSTTLATYSNLNKNTGYAQKSLNLASFAGQTVTLKFTGAEDSSLQTSFVVDDTAVNVS
ncbi:putative Ig domain-containing protein [Actinacidiphila acididurans]|uniref:Ig domain-containing protein n=1 Tax=Actinacidiphila acididurans TaxID=2784346 RepID=A0ABS2U431_9ACTN|nr:putative Ig domain-containing protein [Actinacidiphila acididurans]MBM9510375.1 putative Ig domain-containing protein [Actinacidiphila acididurans]